MTQGPFSEAHDFIEAVKAGEVDPARVQKLIDAETELRNTRARRRRLKMTGDGTVRRVSGLYLPIKYAEAIRERKTITVALFQGRHEVQAADYERQILRGDGVTFEPKESDWGLIDGYSVFVRNVGEYFPLNPPKSAPRDYIFDLIFPKKETKP